MSTYTFSDENRPPAEAPPASLKHTLTSSPSNIVFACSKLKHQSPKRQISLLITSVSSPSAGIVHSDFVQMLVEYSAQRGEGRGGGGIIAFNSKSSPIQWNRLNETEPHGAALMGKIKYQCDGSNIYTRLSVSVIVSVIQKKVPADRNVHSL